MSRITKRTQRVTTATSHDGHVYMIRRYDPKLHGDRALDQIVRWVEDPEMNMTPQAACKMGVEVLRRVAIARLGKA